MAGGVLVGRGRHIGESLKVIFLTPKKQAGETMVQEFAVRKYRIANKARPPARGRGLQSIIRVFTNSAPPARARGWENSKLSSSELLLRVQPTCTRGWGNVSFSDGLGRDSRAVRALAYVVIWAEDSTSRKQARRTGQTEINANGGRLCLWESE